MVKDKLIRIPTNYAQENNIPELMLKSMEEYLDILKKENQELKDENIKLKQQINTPL
ncbi:hypothetical protein GCM10023210_22360 [Chryseobacterium ginsengisoli]|uniref:Transcriptional regulator n=1 Tax=Chryseobacterium ginsengisoli TaxID=363853 RepID=A0ABP9M9A4_9FLAO